jgi:hypothetical protein
VMGVHVSSMDTEGASLGRDLGHLFLHQHQRTTDQNVSPASRIVQCGCSL